MQFIKLGNIVKIKTGKLDANAKVEGGKYPFFTCARDISWIDKPTYDCECVLVAGNGDLNVKYYHGKFDAYQRTYIIESNNTSELSMKYLYYFMQSYLEKLRGQTIGGVIQYIKMNNLTDIQIPFPSFEEQKSIVAKLDKLIDLIDLKKEAIGKTEELTKSVFLEMFGDPESNPKGWKIIQVIEFCDCIVPGRDKPKSFTGDVPWIRTEDLKNLGVTINSLDCIGLNLNEIKEVRAKIVPKDSVIMTCVGDLGVISILGKDSVINQQLHSFQCKNEINNYYLMYMLSYRKDFMFKMANSTTVPYMNKTTCNSIPIFYPGISLQDRFAEVAQRNQLIIENQKYSFQKLQELYNTTAQETFSF